MVRRDGVIRHHAVRVISDSDEASRPSPVCSRSVTNRVKVVTAGGR
jgi:hypothetical protein